MARKTGTGAGAELEKGAALGLGTGSALGAGTESGTGTEIIKSGTGAGDGTKRKTGTGARSGTGAKKTGTGRKRGQRGPDKKKRKTKSPEAIAATRERFGTLPARTQEELDYNARLIQHIIRIQEISTHADIKDPVSMRSAFIAYLALCQEDGFRVSNLAAYAAMGITRVMIDQWSRGTRHQSDPAYKALADFVRSTCALAREQQIADGKINPLIGIFWQRNFDGLRNDTEQIQSTSDDEIETASTTEEYREKYGKLLDE